MLTDQQRKLVEENIKLVYWVIQKYYKRYEYDDDYQSIAFMGLMNAAKNFDPDKGAKFSTYAIPYIKGAIWKENRRILAKCRNDSISRDEFSVMTDYETGEETDKLEQIPVPDTFVDEVMYRADLQAAISQLATIDQNIIREIVYENIPYNDIAKREGITGSAVRMRYCLAIKHLREVLDDSYKENL